MNIKDIVVSPLAKVCLNCGKVIRLIHIDSDGFDDEMYPIEEPELTEDSIKFKIHECEDDDEEDL